MLRRHVRCFVCLLLLSPAPLLAQNHTGVADHVRGEMSFLASDALGGRGSATHDELVAATYVAAQFQSFGLDTAEVQRVPLPSGASTYNAIGILRGTSSGLAQQTILLSSHLDHLGTRRSWTGPVIYHGADDDASGTTAVLELARAFGSSPQKPLRTVVFVCFGSEETGGQGDQYFILHPPVPLASVVAHLEFEMIGQPDRAIRPDQLWLTGWERTDLGPTLARHGAPLVADTHSAQNFFTRSDNFAFAKQGIVAQTVSSYGLGAHYHQPTDDLAHIDFQHLTSAIERMISPIQWLANTEWKPSWNPGGRP